MTPLPLILALLGCSRPAPDAPTVLLVVLDTVRADHTSTFGYGRPTTPNLDALAAEGIRYTRAYSTSGWTSPAHASLFTGLFAVTHGTTQEHWDLARRHVTLAEELRDAGWATVGFVGNPMVSRKRGFAQGFDAWHESWRGAGVPDAQSVHDATAWLATPATRPRFAFVNLIGAHSPYDSCGRSCGAFGEATEGGATDNDWQDVYRGRASHTPADLARLTTLYDTELLEVDRHLGELLDALPAGAVVAVVSDHGENLGDHGHVDHVFSLYESTTQVPVVIRGLGTGTEDRPIQLVDVHATLRAVAGLPGPVGHGADLRALPVDDRAVLTEYYRPRQALGRLLRSSTPEEVAHLARWQHRQRTWTDDGYKLIWRETGPSELYHLTADPHEATDVAALEPARVREWTAALETRLAALGAAAAVEGALATPDDATREALEELGYLE